MNKKKVEAYISVAKEALEKDYTKDKKSFFGKSTSESKEKSEHETKPKSQIKSIEGAYRGQIAAFGSMLAMGNLKSAVAVYSKQGNAGVPRELLMMAIYYIIKNNGTDNVKTEELEERALLEYVNEKAKAETKKDLSTLQEDIICAAVALKLAMNFFDLK